MEPFPIQEMTLPIALMGTDLIGQARTGTGKTLGFGIPLLQRTISPGEPDYEELAAPGKPQALVVTPTRELTIQVAKDLETASTVRTVRVLTIYGGVAYDPQLDQLKKGVDVVVGTPGRLLDLANRGVLDLSHIKVLVLDEADEMLDLGFLPDVERILRKTPELRQTMLFSATMPSAVITLARTHMRHPLNIRAESHDDSQIVPATAQFVYRAHDLDKPEVVARILQADDRGRVMIFCRTKREASRLTDDLVDRGFKAAAIHGDLNQQARERALTRFRGDKVDVLVCTDVAARGIDVEGVTHVVNNTCPEDEKTYIHRIGRTGRAGASGIAVTFVDWADVIRWKTINKALDLPYDEPQEIYSTSPELYHDLGIPTDAKGRIKPAREPEREEKPRREKTARRTDGHDTARRTEGQETARRTEGEESGDRPARNKRNRSRRRTRSGRPMDGVVGEGSEQAEEKSEADVTAKTQVPPTPESSTEAAEVATTQAPQDRKPRQRSRRRRTTEAAAATTSTTETTGATETTAAGATEAAPVAEVTASAAAVEVATEARPADSVAEVEGSAESKPVKRTRARTRKTAEPKPADTEASAPESAPAEASAPDTAPAEAETPAKAPAKKATRARKTAKAAASVEEKAAAAKKAATKAAPAEKTAAKKAAPAEKLPATKAAAAEKKAAKAPAPRAAPTIPTFTAPE